MPKISVITPCYNSERYIGKTIESVLAQTMTDWEQIVVDDGSGDGSVSAVEAWTAREPRVRLVSRPNGGVASARNAGYQNCAPDSTYIHFLDADDCMEPSMLKVMVDYLEANPDVCLAYCDVRVIDDRDVVQTVSLREIGWTPRRVPAGLGIRELRDECAETPFEAIFGLTTIIPSISVMRRSIYAQTPGWDETHGHGYEDTDLFLQMALRGRVHRIAQPLLRYRRHSGQSTSNRDHYVRQEQKLYAKWRALSGISPEQQARVHEAFRFREGRLLPYQGLIAGHRCLRQGRLSMAARFYIGALRRYFGSFLPE